MTKTETVAHMAAAIFAAGHDPQASLDAEEMYQRAATHAWALYDAVEKLAAERFSKL